MLHQIGIGTLGPVFRTYEPTRDRLVAVKVFRLDIVPEQAEALAAALKRATDASLFHPSIVAPIAAGVEGTLAYRAEEYVAAESLDVAMRHYAPAPIEKALPFITQLAGAIDFARAAGIGHGALHPRDVFVTPDEARATGFGVVEALERVGVRAPVRRPYTAPERIDGAAWGIAADVFSLAAIAFELLSGRRPAGAGGEIGSLADGPRREALHEVLARAMDPDPAKRFPNALAFAGALEAASRGEAHAAAPGLASAAAPIAVPIAASTTGAVPPPGEFEIEERLDRSRAPAAAPAEQDDDRMLFGDVDAERDDDDAGAAERARLAADSDEAAGDEAPVEPIPHLGADAAIAADDPVQRSRFADDFVAEQAEPDMRRPLEAVGGTAPLLHQRLEDPMFSADPERPVPDLVEQSRPPVLPMAVVGVLGLLVGFAGGYFVGTRDRLAPPAADTTAAAPPGDAARTGVAPPGPATPDKPGQYSEQKVTPPSPPTEPPPIPSETSRPPSARATGQLIVRSTPSRASVTIDGRWRGRTPLTIDDLPFGTYVVRVVQQGYETARQEVTLDARRASHTYSPRLERDAEAAPPTDRPAPDVSPPATTGSLFVDSRPRGATVYVDGRSVGQTPLSLPEMSIGTHSVRIEMAGKRPWMSTALVKGGAVARVTGSLEDIR